LKNRKKTWWMHARKRKEKGKEDKLEEGEEEEGELRRVGRGKRMKERIKENYGGRGGCT